jgi:tetratricopeptide (TPR) repeat protein
MKRTILLFAISFLFVTVFAQNNTVEKEITSITQKGLDRAFSVLGYTISLLAIILTVFGIIVAVLGFFGVKELIQVKNIRNKVEKDVSEIMPIIDMLEKIKEDKESLSPQIASIAASTPIEKVSDGDKIKFNDFAKKIDFLELLGQPLTAKDYFNRATDFFTKKQYDSALIYFDKAIEQDPNYAEAYVGKGNVYVYDKRKKDDSKALELFLKATEIKRDYVYAWVCIGGAYYRLGRNKEDYENALKAYEKAIELKDNYNLAWIGKGNVFFKNNDYPNALTAYETATGFKPDNHWAWSGKGNAIFSIERPKGESGNWDGAIEAYKKATEIKSDFAWAYQRLAQIYAVKNDIEKMLINLKRTIELNPKFKKEAKEIPDFTTFRNDPKFISITTEEYIWEVD